MTEPREPIATNNSEGNESQTSESEDFDFEHDERELEPGISVHMMVKNPPIDRLAALTTYLLPHVNEIVIVDTGSSPGDIERMESWNYPNTAPVRVFHETFENFSKTRNKGLARHRFEWTFGLDPDELPSYQMMEHMRYVTSPAGMAKHKQALGWLYFSLNWWDGKLGPEEEYHWHVRLWKTKHSWMIRPVHELMMLDGKHEGPMRETPRLPKAPKQAYLIHSKSAADIVKSDTLYATLGEVSK